MADFPKSRIEAFERGEQCGLTAKESDNLYLSKGKDEYNQFTAKQEKCFAGGPDQGFLTDMKGKLTGFFEKSVAGVSSEVKSAVKEAAPLAAELATGYGKNGEGGVTKTYSATAKTDNYLQKMGM